METTAVIPLRISAPVKFASFSFRTPNLPGIAVHDRGKLGFEPGQMGTALGIVNIVAETQDIFLELVDILKGDLHGDAFGFPLEIDRLMNRLFISYSDP